MNTFIHGLGHCHPENEITNAFLESLDIGTSNEWILERVGIRSRRTVLPLDYIRETRNQNPRAAIEAATLSNAELGARAAEHALRRAAVPKEAIGMVIAGSSATDTASPAEACNIAQALGLDVPSFDVRSACTSFYAQLYLLSMMRSDALPEYLLLVAVDTLTKTVDYADRSSSVLWGDGAAAAVISTRRPGRFRVLNPSLQSKPSAADKVVVPRIGHFYQEGRTVQAFGIRRMSQAVRSLREQHETAGRSFHFVGHQANLRMLESVCHAAGVSTSQHHSNVEFFGNTGCASSASVISMRWEKWDTIDDIAVAGVGAGLTWASYLLRSEDSR